MGKRCSLSPTKRSQVIALKSIGLSERNIASQLGISKTAVHGAIVKYETSASFRDAPRAGTPKKSTPADDRVIRRMAVANPRITTRDIGVNL